MKLIIAEKPSLAKNIANALNVRNKKDGYLENDEYVISWAFGHLFSLKEVDDYLGSKHLWKEVELPFFPNKFEFKLKNDDGIKNQFKILKNLLNRQDITQVINCGDADREGQIIIDIILKNINVDKPVKRLWLPEQTEDTIRSQINKCESNENYINLQKEGLSRAYIDWLFGINLTRYVTLKSGSLLPCGRVLIPIVKYIYDRDMAIKHFTPKKYYILESRTKVNDIEVLLSIKDIKYYVDDKDKADEKAKHLNKFKAKVIDIENKEIKKQPPKLFSLSKLQSKLSKDNKISFVDSMNIIQSLYEKGYITYPRTNTEYLAENEKERIQNLIDIFSSYKLEMKDTKAIFDNTKIESHSAIIPTSKIPNNLKEDEELIYKTILNRFISNFLIEDSIINQTTVKISVDNEIFNLKGQSIKQEGFLKYEIQKIENNLPNFFFGQEFDIKFIAEEKITTPPKKITEETLSNYLNYPFRKEKNSIEHLDEYIDDKKEYQDILKGIEIGTEATRTTIIENTKKYGYVNQDKQVFSITDKGIYFIQALDKLNIDLYKEKTVEVSMLQKEVLNETKTIEECMDLVKKQISEIIKKDVNIEHMENTDTREIIGICPRCKGNVYENSKSYYCGNYKNKTNPCNFSIWKENSFFEQKGKKLTKNIVKSLLKKGYADVKGFKSKDKNKEYNAVVLLKDTGKYINFELKFNK